MYVYAILFLLREPTPHKPRLIYFLPVWRQDPA
ncbi:hypothetical protein KPNJ1_02742 [Klebsiella pneumoniae 30660/NJST258_1]|uniref:Uncharacterized protein n=1 Tax=Klebsiella pneumoniae 30684/NJST258_2 TaxID=1420013 RepID=W8VGN8_KLEPN|nr:hypothetical protein KPNJ2_02696 [Klebsiella pneumoniae 30684/NJST258_2]AHM85148.1 hypothetical protein KPNJ1_02742 [Klebsiella pneumoniae 30660/NJST258_1]